jgi:hypothetical protein
MPSSLKVQLLGLRTAMENFDFVSKDPHWKRTRVPCPATLERTKRGEWGSTSTRWAQKDQFSSTYSPVLLAKTSHKEKLTKKLSKNTFMNTAKFLIPCSSSEILFTNPRMIRTFISDSTTAKYSTDDLGLK